MILNRFFGFKTHSIYSIRQDLEQWPEDTRTLADWVGQAEPECHVDSLRSDPKCQHFVKTHNLPTADNSSAIVLVRDGRDAVVSYAHFVLKTEKGVDQPNRSDFEEALLQILRDENFGGWSRNVNAWADRVGYDNVLRYEDLIRNPIGIVAKALDRFSLKGGSPTGTPPSFQELHAVMPWFFRRGTPGGWEDEMPLRIQDLFWDLHGDTLSQFGYSRRPAPRKPTVAPNGARRVNKLSKAPGSR
jgi:hypothetical protein